MKMLGSWEIILIIFFILVLFGPNKIPEFLQHLKIGVKQFKKAVFNISESEQNKV
jgi:TatA/E family protein of Tat protein translocase